MSVLSRFNIPEPTDEEKRQIQYVLITPAWTKGFKLYLQNMRQAAIENLSLPGVERESTLPSDFLRGQIATMTGMLKLADLLLFEVKEEVVEKELTEEEAHAELVNAGRIGEAGQTVPDEDPDEY